MFWLKSTAAPMMIGDVSAGWVVVVVAAGPAVVVVAAGAPVVVVVSESLLPHAAATRAKTANKSTSRFGRCILFLLIGRELPPARRGHYQQ
jgi:uncharacterized membrane protein